jgi:hypothetical protein
MAEEVPVSETDQKPHQKSYWGIPGWAWLCGLAMGAVVGFMIFDNWIISAMFGVSIGVAFAIGFHESEKKPDR